MSLRERVGIGCILLLEILDIGGSHCDGWPLDSQWTGGNWGRVVFVECRVSKAATTCGCQRLNYVACLALCD